VLLTEGALEATELRRAVHATFARRQLAVPGTVPLGLSDAFAHDPAKQGQWAAFVQRNRLGDLALSTVVALLRSEFQKLGTA
jgi:hypothetical protein